MTFKNIQESDLSIFEFLSFVLNKYINSLISNPGNKTICVTFS